MSGELFTPEGARKYLTADELDEFIAAAQRQERAEVRSLCLVLAHSGCRLSEALELTAGRVDLVDGSIRVRTMKQSCGRRAGVKPGSKADLEAREKRENRSRSIPMPESTIDTLELVHGIRRKQKGKNADAPLWTWGRTQAWKHVKAVLDEAGVSGPHASPKGLRHGFGVRAIQSTRNPRLVQKWLGHRSLEVTAIYMDAVDDEERQAARSMWARHEAKK